MSARIRRKARWALLLLLGAAPALGQVPKDTVPLGVDELMAIRSFSLFSRIGSLSPDGQWVSYAVRRCNPDAGKGRSEFHGPEGMRSSNEGCSDLWIANVRTGEAERVSDGSGKAEDSAWSPDGSRLAFYAAQGGPAGLWIREGTGKPARRVSAAIVRPSIFDEWARPRWTPDGKHVVALVLPEGQTVSQFNRIATSPVEPAKTEEPVGSGVIVFRSPAASKPAVSAAVPLSPDSDPDPILRDTSDLAAIATADVALIDATTGAVRRLSLRKPVFWYAPSPDGDWVAYSIMTGFRSKLNARVYAIEVVSVNGGPPRVLAEDVYPDQGVCTWSPDSKHLAYVTGLEPEKSADVYLLEVETGARRNLTPDAPKRASWKPELVGRWMPDGKSLLFAAWGRLWRIPVQGGAMRAVTAADPNREIVRLMTDESGERVWTSDRGRTVTVTMRNPVTKAMGFARVDLGTGRATTLREETRDYGYPPPLGSADGKVVVLQAQDAQHPPDLWTSGPDLSEPRRVTDLNPQIRKVPLGASRVVDYFGSDGQPLRGALLLPSGYAAGRRVPLIVEVYPGDYKHSNSVHRFGFGDTSGPFNKQMLATRGFAVLFPETPQGIGTPMRDLTANTNAAINRVIELGIADPDRLGVFGHSYGGFSALSLLTQTTRFRAGVMSGGGADLSAFYGEIQDSGLDSWRNWVEDDARMGGAPWQYPVRYVANSPIYSLDRVMAPLLILHGAEDSSVRPHHAEQVFSGLRHLGREVELRKYPGEGHVLEQRENIVDYWKAVIRWFETYLRTDKADRRAGRP
ncbi:MAG: prolyl oligopeptidase family serine peptidase [Thermoanaerobaculia bacterium]